jgi:hypothetical protein
MPTPAKDKNLKLLNIDVAKYRADAAPLDGGGVVPKFGRANAAPRGGGFVPELEIPWAPKNEINVNETVILTLKIRNWNQAPKGIKLSWGESISGDAVDIESEHHDGKGSIKVTGKAVGEGKIRAEVKIGEGDAGRSYSFADTEFVVRGGCASERFCARSRHPLRAPGAARRRTKRAPQVEDSQLGYPCRRGRRHLGDGLRWGHGQADHER